MACPSAKAHDSFIGAPRHPGTDNLDPTCCVSTANSSKVTILSGLVEVHGEQGSHPGSSQEEDNVEHRVTVLSPVSLIVSHRSVASFTLVIGEQSIGGQTAFFNGSAQGLCSHFTASTWLLRHKTVLIVLRQLDTVRITQTKTLSCGPSGGVSDGCDTKEQASKNEMEETKRKVDSVNSKPAMAFACGTIDRNIIEGEFLQLFDRPRREHYPGDDRIDKEEERVCDSSCDTIAAFATCAADHRTSCSTAAAGSEGYDLIRRLALVVRFGETVDIHHQRWGPREAAKTRGHPWPRRAEAIRVWFELGSDEYGL
ncbi:hypothetical protein HG530_000055 [Fusarium avenaceum]|nr:hypothetical protein HG530_000055 [Fusarium avenaceum]